MAWGLKTYEAKMPLPPRKCMYCGMMFVPSSREHIYCGIDCNIEALSRGVGTTQKDIENKKRLKNLLKSV